MIKMSDIIADIEFLPPFSKVAQKALEIIRQPDFTMKELSELIIYDPALTANILKVANSALYARTQVVSDLQTAISFLGAKEMSSIILLSAANKYFEQHLEGYEVYHGEIWEHSLSVAVNSQELKYLEPEIDDSTLFTAALLHDVGKLILSKYVLEKLDEINELIRTEGVNFITAERKIVGFSHTVVGAAVLKKWNFSKTICEVAKYYKNPERVNNPYVNIVAMADFVSIMIGKSSQKDGLAYSGCAPLFTRYKISSRQLDVIITRCADRTKELIENLNL
ncbi:MAG: HDOD domain-containing protein [Candidatus Cloacimonetes bacterium]|nr:HDOD domain-containing protein [Candidatus Cloacimonadota bacterium]